MTLYVLVFCLVTMVLFCTELFMLFVNVFLSAQMHRLLLKCFEHAYDSVLEMLVINRKDINLFANIDYQYCPQYLWYIWKIIWKMSEMNYFIDPTD